MPQAPFEIIIEASNSKKAFAKIKGTEAIGFKKTYSEFSRPKGVRESTIIQAIQNSLIVHDLDMNGKSGHPQDPPSNKSEIKQRISIINKFDKFAIVRMSEVWDVEKPVGVMQLNHGKYLCFGIAYEK